MQNERRYFGCFRVLIGFGRDDGSADDVAQLAGFVVQIGQLDVRQQFALDDQPNPATRFAQFLQADVQFVNKILTTFRCASFFIVRSGRRSTTNQLAGNMPP